MEQKFICSHCGTKFHRETTLHTHICIKKRRYLDRESPGPRLGFRVYQRYHEMVMRSKKIKSIDDFIQDSFYIDFVRFGNHLALLRPLYQEKYVEYIFTNGIKIKDWVRDDIYYLYIVDLIQKEPATSAVERTISEIMEWCDKNSTSFCDFFVKVSENEAAYLIQVGKISPWVLYLSGTGGNLMSRFTDDHKPMIESIIDPTLWKRKFIKNKDDVEYISTILEQAGI